MFGRASHRHVPYRHSYMEPDPRDDLCAMDVRRKIVVLARELGLRIELDDVSCESFLPAELDSWEPQARSAAASVHHIATSRLIASNAPNPHCRLCHDICC